jgi:small-conductance mechanosensitive channel
MRAPGPRPHTRKRALPPPAASKAAATVSWFVPDISPATAADKAAAAAAWEAVKDMGLGELCLRGVAEVGAAFAVAGLAVSLLARAAAAADAHSDRVEEEEGSAAGAAAAVGDAPPPTGTSSWFTLAADAAVGAALRPARVLAPLAAAAQAARTAALVLQILLRKAAVSGAAKSGGAAGAAAAAAADRVGGLLALLDGAALDLVQVAAIAGVAWFAVAWKDRLVALALRLAARAEAGSGGVALTKGGAVARSPTAAVDGLERILVPFAGLASWGIVTIAGIGCATALGVDVRPLLTVGGVGGLAVGFGAQAVTSNAIAGLTLYLTRPFVVGERVTLQTPSGAAVVTGVVERIDPMRTLVRSDRAAPVSIPNKALSDFLVVNESRIRASPVLTGFNDPRQFTMTVDVRHEDLDKVLKKMRKKKKKMRMDGWEGWLGGARRPKKNLSRPHGLCPAPAPALSLTHPLGPRHHGRHQGPPGLPRLHQHRPPLRRLPESPDPLVPQLGRDRPHHGARRPPIRRRQRGPGGGGDAGGGREWGPAGGAALSVCM